MNYPVETPIIDSNRTDPNTTVNGIVIDDGVWSGVPGQKNYWIFDGLVLRNWKRAAFWIGGDDSNAENTFTKINEIQLNGWNRGMYIVKVNQQGVLKTAKLIVE